MHKIKVLDSIMGSGKTTYVLKMLRDAHEDDLRRTFVDDEFQERRFLVVVPYLAEVNRYQTECPSLRFYEPKQVDGRKIKGLLDLIDQGANIVTSHSLFLGLTKEIAKAIKVKGYSLIVDETPEVLSLVDNLTHNDLELLKAQDMLRVDPGTGGFTWNPACDDYVGRFSDVKADSLDGYLVASGPKEVLFRLFPSDFFRCFDSALVCTYLFKGSVFDAYCQTEGLAVDITTLDENNQLVEHSTQHEAKHKGALTSKLIIYRGQRNKIGETKGRTQPLSSSWFRRAEEKQLKQLKSATETFFDREAKTCSNESGWTTYKSYQHKLKGKGYTKGFIAANARATNDYVNKAAMAFLCNWFEHPSIINFFKRKGVIVDQDQVALSTLLQWIWRSRIRRGEAVHLFIPSERMRSLLVGWLEAKVGPQGETEYKEAA